MQADTSMTWRRDLAWCSSSSAEIARATGLLDVLRKQGVIDARGFLVLNGAFADRLYPGVITIVTARQSGVAPTLRGHPRLAHLCRSRSSSPCQPRRRTPRTDHTRMRQVWRHPHERPHGGDALREVEP